MTYGSNQTTTGDMALKFYASVRLEIRRIGAVKEGEQMVGNRTLVKVVKNKLAPPFREAEIDILYGKGVNREGELVDLAMDAGIIKKSGSWFALNDQQLGQGRSAACQWLSEHPEVREKLAAHPIERAKKSASGDSAPATTETGAAAPDGKTSQVKAA